MKSITDLLTDLQTSTNDWYEYAKSMYKSVAFEKGTQISADDLIPKLFEKIQGSLAIQELSFLQIQRLILAVGDVVREKEETKEIGWITAWASTTYMIIQEELNKKLHQLEAQQSSTDIASLLYTIKLLNTVNPITHKARQKQDESYAALSDVMRGEVTKIQTEITEYKDAVSDYVVLNVTNFLKKEENFLMSAAPIRQKLSRQGQMLAKLSDFEEMLSNYENYLSLHTDDMTRGKLDIIQDLNDTLHNRFLPPCMKIYRMEEIINDPNNKKLLMHDTWGEKLVNFIQDILSIIFTRTPTASEIYKENLFSMKQDDVTVQETITHGQRKPGIANK